MKAQRAPRSRARGGPLAICASLGLGIFLGCGQETPEDPSSNFTDPAEVFATMPAWSAYSPPLPDAPAAPDSAPRPTQSVMLDVEVVDVDGALDTLTNQTYVCTETPYSVTNTPERLVMYNPQASVLWAGGFIQGQSRKDLGSLQGLVVDERAPIDVVIQGVLGVGGAVSITVDNPSLGSVQQAVNDLVANATMDDLETASSVVLKTKTFHSEEEVGLSLGASGRYLGFTAGASYNSNINESQTTVVAEFYERMFTIVVPRPSTPMGFFTSDFTGEVMATKYGGQISAENPPLYISEVVYGRSLMYSMTATASESEIRATLEASHKAITNSASVSLSARQETLLREAEIAVVSLGGNQQNILSLIENNDLKAYFEQGAPLTSADPLSYTFSTLDGQIAHVSETTDYVLRECEPRGTGSLSFLDTQTHISQLSGSFTSYPGDFDGDGNGDLLWNHLSGATNEVFIGFGQDDGTFRFDPVQVWTGTAPAVGWGAYDMHVVDHDGDGTDDVVWVANEPTFLSVYSGLSAGGTFSWTNETLFTANGWHGYDAVFGDFDADGDADLAMNETTNNRNRFYFGEGDGSGLFTFGGGHNVANSPGWQLYRPARVGNVDHDVADEIVLHKLDAENAIWIAQLNPTTKQFELNGVSSRGGGWYGYEWHLADIDGVNGADVIDFNNGPQLGGDGTYSWLADGDRTFTAQPIQGLFGGGYDSSDYVGHVGDLNRDGKDDFVVNRTVGNDNQVLIAFGEATGDFSVPAGIQNHPLMPVNGWDLYETRILDVNGDGKDDVVWSIPQGDLEIHVGLAR